MSSMLEKKHIQNLRYNLFCTNQRIFYHGVIRWLKFIFWAEVLHLKELNGKLDRPLVIVGNHASGWDPFLAYSSLNRPFFKKHILWRIPVYHEIYNRKHLKPFFKFIGAYPIKSEGSLEKSLQKTLDLLDRGHNTIFFPEGKRIFDGESAKPKRGIGYIIKNRDVYILPVFIKYSKRGRNGFGAKIGSRARVVFGSLYKSEYFRDRYSEERMHFGVMESVYELEEAFVKNELPVNRSTAKVEL